MRKHPGFVGPNARLAFTDGANKAAKAAVAAKAKLGRKTPEAVEEAKDPVWNAE